jgi:hypothetical protein
MQFISQWRRGRLTDAIQRTIYLRLTDELWMFAFHSFKLDCNFLARRHIGSVVNVSKGATADLPS